MARKKEVFDNEIEVIDFDIADIEDRVLDITKSDIFDELPEIADALDFKDDLPEIADIADEKDELPEIADVADEKDELPEIADAEVEEKETSVAGPEDALAAMTQTVAAMLKKEDEKGDFDFDVKPESKKSDSDDVEFIESLDEDETKPDKKKKSSSDIVRSFLMVVCICIIVYAGYQLTMIFMEYKEADDEYEEIEKLITTEEATYNADYNMGDPFNPNFTPTQIDWQSLAALNSDVCAWIEFENSEIGINYPVAMGDDSGYYLDHTINKTKNSSGSIYIDSESDPYFGYTNTIIHGHNMKNGSMFGNLRHYKKAEYYPGNEYLWIYTPDSRSRYKIFACYDTPYDSDTYTWWKDYCDEYTAYLQTAKERSWYDTGTTVAENDSIITLSTCTSSGDDNRFVVQAKLIYREYK